MWAKLRTALARRRLRPEWSGLLDTPTDEYVSLDCETTSLNVREAEILSIGAVRLTPGHIHASESLYLLVKPERLPEPGSVVVHGLRPSDLSDGLPPAEAVGRLLEFIGGRALVGYYLEYDVAVLNKYVRPLIGTGLPQPQIDVSGLYYDWKLKQTPDGYVDLRLQSILDELHLPSLGRHDALTDAITAAVIWQAMASRGHPG
ncbi:MAG: 3'-5' exonuclease [Microvirgula sp.]